MADNPYSTQTISGYNATPPADDGSQVASNQVTWAKHKTKLGDPLKTLAEAIDTACVTFGSKVINTDDAQANTVEGSIAYGSDELTISAGAITPDKSHHTVDTEADAATDNLDTINTGSVNDGCIIYLRQANAARVVTVRDDIGNVKLMGDHNCVLDVNHSLMLMRVGTDWIEIGRPTNAVLDANSFLGLGVAAADGLVHAHTASAGAVTSATDADEIIAENNDDAGISILTPAANKGQIAFGDAADNNVGQIIYDHTSDTFQIVAGAAEIARVWATSISIGSTTQSEALFVNGSLSLVDGMTAPSTATGQAKIYVDTADSILKVNQSGTVSNIVAQAADTATAGIVEIATDAESDAGTSSSLAVPPSGLEESRKRIRESVAKAGAYTITATDAGMMIRTTATGAITLTMNASVLTPDDVILVNQFGAGQVTISGTATIRTPETAKTRKQYSTISLYAVTATEILLTGDLEAA